MRPEGIYPHSELAVREEAPVLNRQQSGGPDVESHDRPVITMFRRRRSLDQPPISILGIGPGDTKPKEHR